MLKRCFSHRLLLLRFWEIFVLEKWNDWIFPFSLHHCAKSYEVAWIRGEVLTSTRAAGQSTPCFSFSSPWRFAEAPCGCLRSARRTCGFAATGPPAPGPAAVRRYAQGLGIPRGVLESLHHHPGAWASVWTCKLVFIIPYFFQSHLYKILNMSLRKQWAKVPGLSMQFTASLV